MEMREKKRRRRKNGGGNKRKGKKGMKTQKKGGFDSQWRCMWRREKDGDSKKGEKNK